MTKRRSVECTYPSPGSYTPVVEIDISALEMRVAAKLAGERVCACGCLRSLEGRSARCNYYEDKCRAKGFHTRQTANTTRPIKRTPKKQRVSLPDSAPKPRRTEPVPAPSPPAADPRPIKTREKTKKEKVVYDAEARRQTEENNNTISWALTEQSSYCKMCRRPGGGKPGTGGAGALRTKMGKPGALCDDCWKQVYPEEGT